MLTLTLTLTRTLTLTLTKTLTLTPTLTLTLTLTQELASTLTMRNPPPQHQLLFVSFLILISPCSVSDENFTWSAFRKVRNADHVKLG